MTLSIWMIAISIQSKLKLLYLKEQTKYDKKNKVVKRKKYRTLLLIEQNIKGNENPLLLKLIKE